MNIFEVLKRDHRSLSALLRRLGDTTERSCASRATLLRRARESFETHARAEEHVVYSALRDVMPAHQLILEGDEQHRLATRLFVELEQIDADDERWHARFKLLVNVLDDHIEQEERQLFPLARKLLMQTEQLELARQMGAAVRNVRVLRKRNPGRRQLALVGYGPLRARA